MKSPAWPHANHTPHPNNNFFQARELSHRLVTDEDRDHLIGNIVDYLGNAAKHIQLRQTAIFYKADSEYGTRVAAGLGLDVKKVKGRANTCQEKRVKATALGR